MTTSVSSSDPTKSSSAVAEAGEKPRTKRQRFVFIDEMRGLVGVMMALGHSNYYFNSVWYSLDPIDPFFGGLGQFCLRYMASHSSCWTCCLSSKRRSSKSESYAFVSSV